MSIGLNLPSEAGDKARQYDCRRQGPCLNLSREREKEAVTVNWSWSYFLKAPKISVTLCLSLSSLLSTWQLNFCCQMSLFLVALPETTGPEALTCLGNDSYRNGPQTVQKHQPGEDLGYFVVRCSLGSFQNRQAADPHENGKMSQAQRIHISEKVVYPQQCISLCNVGRPGRFCFCLCYCLLQTASKFLYPLPLKQPCMLVFLPSHNCSVGTHMTDLPCHGQGQSCVEQWKDSVSDSGV